MKPKTIDDVTAAFPASVRHLMPLAEPEYQNYRENWVHGDSWGYKLFSDWFYKGVKNLKLVPKPDIDPEMALRHIRAIMRSFEPQHEDKTASCAYLFEHWFESGTWEPNT